MNLARRRLTSVIEQISMSERRIPFTTLSGISRYYNISGETVNLYHFFYKRETKS